jgi:hypothetical protein
MNDELKIVINICYGGFSLCNDKLMNEFAKRKNINIEEEHYPHYMADSYTRHDKDLVELVEKYPYSDRLSTKLSITKIPMKFKEYYMIKEYDGMEYVYIDKYHYMMNEINNFLKNEENKTVDSYRLFLYELINNN